VSDTRDDAMKYKGWHDKKFCCKRLSAIIGKKIEAVSKDLLTGKKMFYESIASFVIYGNDILFEEWNGAAA
jgi:hypothetical protein